MQSLGISTANLWFQSVINAFDNFFNKKDTNSNEEYKLLGKIELCVDNAEKTQAILENFDWKTPSKDDLIALEKEALALSKQQASFEKTIKQLAKQNSNAALKKAFKELLAAEKKVSLAIEDFLGELDFLLDDEAQILLDKIHNDNLEDFSPYQHLQ